MKKKLYPLWLRMAANRDEFRAEVWGKSVVKLPSVSSPSFIRGNSFFSEIT